MNNPNLFRSGSGSGWGSGWVVQYSTHSMTQSQTDTPPIEATAEGVA